MRKFFLASLAVLPLTLLTSTLRADTLSLKTGTTVDVLTVADVTYMGVAAKQYSYTNETIGTLGALGAVLSSSTSTFVATYAALTPTASVLNVTDACVTVYLLGSGPGCQSFAFSLTNATLGDGEVGLATASLLVNASATEGLGFAGLTINGVDVQGVNVEGISIGGASGTFNFGPPPAATPEPSSLCLMATGLATAAGAIRRRVTRSVA
ncbi:MAG: hypothetical protein NVSMB62_01870 [Acidobacteriaceae bacterium]